MRYVPDVRALPRLALALSILVAVPLAGCDAEGDPAPLGPGPESFTPTSPSFAEAGVEVDLTWYDGSIYHLLFPSGSSQNPTQFTFGCFDLGPDQTGTTRESAGVLYGVLLPGATMDSCPDGSVLHDHVVSAVPGDPDFTPFWEVVFVTPGPNFDPGIMPLTSEEAIEDAEAAGQVVLTPAGFVVEAGVVAVPTG